MENKDLWMHLITVASIFIFKIVALIIGFYTVKMGYHLVEKGVKGEFKFSADYKGSKAALASSSPGLLFLLLGIFLLCIAIFKDKPFNTDIIANNNSVPNRQEVNYTPIPKPTLLPFFEGEDK